MAATQHQQQQRKQWLPHDLVAENILTRLPVKDLLLYKSVCKQWYSTLSSHQFALKHFKLSPFSCPSNPIQFLLISCKRNCYLFCYQDELYENNTISIGSLRMLVFTAVRKALRWVRGDTMVLPFTNQDIDKYTMKSLCKFEIDLNIPCDDDDDHHHYDNEIYLVGSCNGLVCFESLDSGYFIIYNPITCQSRTVLDFSLLERTRTYMVGSNECRVSVGFGYVSSTDDYKIVRILELTDTLEILVDVFSLRSNSWRRIDAKLYEDLFSLRTTQSFKYSTDENNDMIPVAYCDYRGVLVNEYLYWTVAKTHEFGWYIISFDLVLERFDIFPHLVVSDDHFLCVMEGCLSSWQKYMDQLDIHVLQSPGAVESICLKQRKGFRDLRLCTCEDLIGFTGTGKCFVHTYDSRSVLWLVDPSSEPTKSTALVLFEKDDKYNFAAFVPSLISPLDIA